MKVFISGGCKNGKSTYAQKIAKWLSQDTKSLYYIATMLPHDDEDLRRIARHRQNRAGMGFETVECGKDVSNINNLYEPNSTFLLDSLTALLANEMFLQDGSINLDVSTKIASELSQVLEISSNIVVVSDYIYSDSMVYDEYTNIYRKELSYLDRFTAACCDVVIEVSFSSLTFFKGKELLHDFLNYVS